MSFVPRYRCLCESLLFVNLFVLFVTRRIDDNLSRRVSKVTEKRVEPETTEKKFLLCSGISVLNFLLMSCYLP